MSGPQRGKDSADPAGRGVELTGAASVQAGTTVFVVDDHPLFLKATSALLREHGFAVIGTATNADDALEAIGDRPPEVVVLDLHLPRADGVRCLETLRARHPDVLVVVLSGSEEGEDIRGALAAGAVAYVLKSGDPEDVVAAVRQAFHRSVFLPPAVDSRTRTEPRWNLTRRETEILRHAAEGLSNSDIAKQLWITEQTVKFHLSNVYRKLSVSNRTEASRAAEEAGILGEDAAAS